jgi:hypothetical protein
MNKCIVTTTINPPTEALIKYSQFSDWQLIVVGDKKTPAKQYDGIDCIFYPWEHQDKDFSQLSSQIGWNCIQRRNLGFLKALQIGAQVIATVDDDNIPLDNWGKNLLVGKELEISCYESEGIFDPISVTNYPHLWHRGFPIQQLQNRNYKKSVAKIRIDIEASFWNGDPDIDAICRMEYDPKCEFESDYFPFTTNLFSPFNSQNTFLTRSALKKYFMFPKVGRMDDIWGGYYLQSLGFNVVYTAPTVRQDRNQHNLTLDFRNEVQGYLHTEEFLSYLKDSPERIIEIIGQESFDALMIYLKLAESFE